MRPRGLDARNLEPDDRTPLLVIEGGREHVPSVGTLGLADRPPAVERTDAASENEGNQRRLENALRPHEALLRAYEGLRAEGLDREQALLVLWDDLGNDGILTKAWPRAANFRVARRQDVRTKPLSPTERRSGITSGPFWVPFEKGDQSQEVTAEGAGPP